ncbi:cupin domain-containing protein [Streptomyces sp. NPDC047046]|uniref:cupin domain-containing protein n=1 Tax=Streptomyces sp. NPDC047046 TaxID=3155378 RepID=UPI0033DC8113
MTLPAGIVGYGTTAGAAIVHGVHGAAGVTHWKAFAGRRQLASPTEAVEWASIPPHGLSGEHRHTRTEEIYLILDGEGEFLYNGTAHPVRPGFLALTAIGNIHGLRNTGDTHLNWWVIETLAPTTDAVLTGTASRTPGVTSMRPPALHDLFKERTVTTDGVFTGPLRSIEVMDLEAGEHRTLGRSDAELAVFVHDGHGTARTDGATADLTANTCLTLSAGTATLFEPTTRLRLLVVTLVLPGEGGTLQ